MSHNKQFYINGRWVDPVKQCDLNVDNPATEKLAGVVSCGTGEDVDRAVAAGRAAFELYSKTSREERLNLLERLLEIYQKRYSDLALVISTEMGAPKRLSESAQVGSGMAYIQDAIRVLKEFTFQQEAHGGLLVREPIGVCGLITPWNWPISLISLKVVPALASGCTVVLKPSEVSPMSAVVWSEIIDEAGFPDGVYNMINGDGSVGALLSAHTDVDMISFTGSTVAGIKVARAAARTVKRVVQELGGKSPNIILNDADLETSIKGSVQHCMLNSGQTCNAPTRLLVHQGCYEAAVDIARSTCNEILVGDPSLDGPHIGPLASRPQYEKVQAFIQKGIDEGARLVCGGIGRPEGFDTGYYVKPTIFADVTNDMVIARTEIFGPVLCIIPYQTDDQAVAIANDTSFGLAAYIRGSTEHARGIAKQLKAGMVHLNGTSQELGAPFGGYKQSGNGREAGCYGFDDYLETKMLSGFQEGVTAEMDMAVSAIFS